MNHDSRLMPMMGDASGARAIRQALSLEGDDVFALCYLWNQYAPHGQEALEAKLFQIDILIEKYKGIDA